MEWWNNGLGKNPTFQYSIIPIFPGEFVCAIRQMTEWGSVIRCRER